MDGSHVTWAGVAYALIVTLPAIIAAVVGLLNRKALRTGSVQTVGQIATDVSHQLVTGNDKTVGEMVADVHGVASTDAVPFTQHTPGMP